MTSHHQRAVLTSCSNTEQLPGPVGEPLRLAAQPAPPTYRRQSPTAHSPSGGHVDMSTPAGSYVGFRRGQHQLGNFTQRHQGSIRLTINPDGSGAVSTAQIVFRRHVPLLPGARHRGHAAVLRDGQPPQPPPAGPGGQGGVPPASLQGLPRASPGAEPDKHAPVPMRVAPGLARGRVSARPTGRHTTPSVQDRCSGPSLGRRTSRSTENPGEVPRAFLPANPDASAYWHRWQGVGGRAGL